MEYITLQNTDLSVSRLCMGGCPMGMYGWGHLCESDLMAAVHTALDHGINFFDTADVYGLGTSERILGNALESRRQDAIIATKFGVRVENGISRYDNSPGWILHACEASLRRLGTDYIDLYQVHYLDGITDISCIVDTLKTLQQQGKIRWFGLSNIQEENIPALIAYQGVFSTVQNQYSLACREQEEALVSLQTQLSLTPLTWGSLGQGILTGKYDRTVAFDCSDRRSRSTYTNFHGEKLTKNLAIVEVLKDIAERYHKPVSSVAIRFILDHLKGSCVLCGAKRPEQVIQNVQAMCWKLTDEELELLKTVSG